MMAGVTIPELAERLALPDDLVRRAVISAGLRRLGVDGHGRVIFDGADLACVLSLLDLEVARRAFPGQLIERFSL